MDEPWQGPAAIKGRGLGAVETGDEEEGTGWGRQPVGGFVGTGVVVLDVDLEGSIGTQLQAGGAITDRVTLDGVIDQQTFEIGRAHV